MGGLLTTLFVHSWQMVPGFCGKFVRKVSPEELMLLSKSLHVQITAPIRRGMIRIVESMDIGRSCALTLFTI